MSGKLVECSLSSDEKLDLRKQIGCVDTIFQLFGLYHFLGGRRIAGHKHNKLLPPVGQNADHGMELKSSTKKHMEKNQEVVKEKQRLSTESSRTSFSSSSFSSVECNKIAQAVPSSSGQSINLKTPSRVAPGKSQISSLYSGRQSSDFQDVVKESMYREVSALSVKRTPRKERVGHVMKHIDSPRPLQSPRTVQFIVNGFDDPIQVISKLHEAPNNSKPINDGSLPLARKDTPRCSYDGLESREALRSSIKLKELPRLSLDSRQRSLRSFAPETRSNYLIKDLQRTHENPSKVPISQQEPGSNKRPSGVVAKLMGFEAFPDTTSSTEMQIINNQPHTGEDFDTRSSRTDSESKQDQVSGSQRLSQKDLTSPRSRNSNSVMKTASASKCPLEPAPWKHPDSGRGSQKPAAKNKETPSNAPHVSTSVYGEIEKRLTQLEFKKSGKDLRALKQILEAMKKTREGLESKKEEGQAPGQYQDYECQRSKYSPSHHNSDQGLTSERCQNQQESHQVSSIIQGTGSPKRLQSPILATKPTKVIEKNGISCSSVIPGDDMPGLGKLRTHKSVEKRKQLVDKQTAKDLTPRSSYIRHTTSDILPSMDKKTNSRTSKIPQPVTGEHSSSGRSSGADSPRLQQKKHGMEKQSRSTTTSPHLGRARGQFSKQTIESGSPGRKLKNRPMKEQQHDSQQDDISGEKRDSFENQNDTASIPSESNTNLASQIDTEVISTYSSREIKSLYQQKCSQDKNPATRLSEGRSIELAQTVLEQPSPISVLDATFYGEESPSPVKKTSCAFKDDETLTSNEEEWDWVDLEHLQNGARDSLSSNFNHKNLETIKRFVHKLGKLSSTSDEARMNHIAYLSWGTNSDHRYISEILLASGLCKDLSAANLRAIRPSSSGHLINPNLFHVLEQTKGDNEFAKKQEKIMSPSTAKEALNKKLIFDAVNEILFNKFAVRSSLRLGGRDMSSQNLLKELCSEIDHCQNYSHSIRDDEDGEQTRIFDEDMMHKYEDWADYSSELPCLILDIERLIFKELITEVIM